LARKALAAENASHGFDKQIAQLDAMIAKLQEKAEATPEGAEQPAATSNTKPAATTDGSSSKEWKNFDEENAKWKKKQIYD
jgi:hypothetical protein